MLVLDGANAKFVQAANTPGIRRPNVVSVQTENMDWVLAKHRHWFHVGTVQVADMGREQQGATKVSVFHARLESMDLDLG
jgi:hypothetical protein